MIRRLVSVARVARLVGSKHFLALGNWRRLSPLPVLERMLDFWRTNQYWFGKERNLDPAELTSDQRMSLAHAIRNRLLYAIDHPHALQLLPDLRDVPWIQIAAQIQIYADWFDYIA